MNKHSGAFLLGISFLLGCATAPEPSPLPEPIQPLPEPAVSPKARARAAASRGEFYIPAAFQDQTVTIECDDGYRLAANYLHRRQFRGRMPGVLLLHGYGESRQVWFPLTLHLASRGYAVLTADLRGHGENPGYMGNSPAGHGQLAPEDFLMMPKDIRNCVGHLAIRNEIDGGRICIIGSSLGANLALITAAQSWADAVRLVIAISPGLEYNGLAVDSAVRQIPANKAVHLAAAREDEYAYKSALQILGALKSSKHLYEIEGPEHGEALFRGRLFPRIPEWIMERMPPVLPERAPGNN